MAMAMAMAMAMGMAMTMAMASSFTGFLITHDTPQSVGLPLDE
jgi:sugar phosphate permease